MKKLLIILFCLSCSVFANEYILVEDYYKNKPNQKLISEKFTELIRLDGKKIFIKQKKPVKIYMVYPGEQISDYWRRSKISFEARLIELNIDYELIDYFTKPSIEISKQAQALYKALKEDTDYLIFTLDATKHFKFISTMLNRDKPKIILQNITTPLKAFSNKQPFLYDGFDHTIGAKILANEYLKQVGKNGNYVVLYGSKGYVSYMRGDSFISYIGKNSNLKLLDSYYADFNKEKAKLATFDILKNHKDIDFIYACSTDIALGAIEALEEKSMLGKIKVNGWGGGSNEIKSIKKGEMDFTVMRINDDNGIAMAEAIKLDLQNQKNKIPLIFSGEFELIKKGISDDKLNKLKAKAFRYSGN